MPIGLFLRSLMVVWREFLLKPKRSWAILKLCKWDVWRYYIAWDIIGQPSGSYDLSNPARLYGWDEENKRPIYLKSDFLGGCYHVGGSDGKTHDKLTPEQKKVLNPYITLICTCSDQSKC